MREERVGWELLRVVVGLSAESGSTSGLNSEPMISEPLSKHAIGRKPKAHFNRFIVKVGHRAR